MAQHKWHIGDNRIDVPRHPKEWQGLTKEEVDDCIAKSKWNNIDYCPDYEDFAKHIEQKLKEKNYD